MNHVLSNKSQLIRGSVARPRPGAAQNTAGCVQEHAGLSRSVQESSKTLCHPLPRRAIYSRANHAGVAKWQTHQTQNLAVATPCGFDSRPRHHSFPANNSSGPPACTLLNGGSYSAEASMIPRAVSWSITISPNRIDCRLENTIPAG